MYGLSKARQGKVNQSFVISHIYVCYLAIAISYCHLKMCLAHNQSTNPNAKMCVRLLCFIYFKMSSSNILIFLWQPNGDTQKTNLKENSTKNSTQTS